MAAAIDSLVHLWLAVDLTPGISIAVVQHGDTLALWGYGVADVEQQIPVTDRTVFGIASVTKQFTAAAVMRLVDQNRLRLDDTVGQLLPEYDGPGRSATVHQLLNHTSGIPTYTRREVEDWELRHRNPTSDQILALFAADPLEFEPGSRWAYNNSAYFLLGLILERVSGASFADHVDAALIRPLGLEQTGSCGLTEVVPNRARAYTVERGRLINAAPHDLSVHGGAGASGQTLLPYGYGVYLGQQNGRSVISHRGGMPGFAAVLTHYPDDDLTIAVLANGPAPVWTLQEQIAGRVLGIEGSPWDPHTLSARPPGTSR